MLTLVEFLSKKISVSDKLLFELKYVKIELISKNIFPTQIK